MPVACRKETFSCKLVCKDELSGRRNVGRIPLPALKLYVLAICCVILVMRDESEVFGWKNGQTAEDLARLVHESLGESQEGVVVVLCEDFTLPDHVAFGGNFNHEGIVVPYAILFSGALEHFHGIKAVGFRAVPTDAPIMTPFSMALEIDVSRQQLES